MHFLKVAEVPAHPSHLRAPHAAVRARFEKRGRTGRALVIDPDADIPICGVRTDAALAPLPEDVVVEGPDGTAVLPTWRFFVTCETINPYHLLLDVQREAVR